MIYAYGEGNVHLTILNGNDKLSIVLKDVLFKRNTFLSCQSQKEELLLNSKVKHMKSPLMESSTPDKTCCIGKTNNQEPLELWPQRYGYLGYDNLKLLNNTDMVNGLNFDSKKAVDQNCEGCAIGKQHRQPFPKKVKSTTTGLLKLNHSDVCGPMNVPSVGGSRYFVTVIDSFSRYATVYVIKQKSDVFPKFR